jgi:hypothetical protein
MSVIDLIKCEGSNCPMKYRCLRYAPNRHRNEIPFKYLAIPPFKRDGCVEYLEKRDVSDR